MDSGLLSTAITPSLNYPICAYPLRASSKPPEFVIGEKAGQKVYPSGQVSHPKTQLSLPPRMGTNSVVGTREHPSTLSVQKDTSLGIMEQGTRGESEGSKAVDVVSIWVALSA